MTAFFGGSANPIFLKLCILPLNTKRNYVEHNTRQQSILKNLSIGSVISKIFHFLITFIVFLLCYKGIKKYMKMLIMFSLWLKIKLVLIVKGISLYGWTRTSAKITLKSIKSNLTTKISLKPNLKWLKILSRWW